MHPALSALASDSRLAFLSAITAACPEAECFVVGGAVRDALLGRPLHDIDIVVRRAPIEKVAAALEPLGAVSVVGRMFGVMKFHQHGTYRDIDIAWPRTERAGMSGGYRDFSVQSDADLPIERDLARRDFTVNAMALRVGDASLVDPYGGMQDLAARRLRAVGTPAARFAEDHTRLLRALRFACQLGFTVEDETWRALLAAMPRLDDLRDDGERVTPYELVARELVKSYAADPVAATDLWEKSGALFAVLPELRPLSSCAQSPDHHAEGDVWAHTKLALAQSRGPIFRQLFPEAANGLDAETSLAVLLHDVGKPATAEDRGDRITFYGHDVLGEEMVRAAAERIRLASAGIDVERLAWLVRHHLFPNAVKLEDVRRVTLAKYFLQEPYRGRQLLQLACCDACGTRPNGGDPDLSRLRALLAVLGEVRASMGDSPRGLLSGDEVMAAADVQPGPEVGALLDDLREAQLTGRVKTPDDAKRYLLERKKAA